MKKISILGLCLIAGLSASAQTSLVKDVERQMKSSVEKYPSNLETLKPAFTNPETADNAQTWFVAGKGALDYFDNQQAQKQIGKQTDDKVLGHAMIDSYGFLRNAILKDSVADKKGKIKTKYSKDIVKLINSHYGDYNNAAIYLWGVQDYDGAYDAWQIYVTAPNDPAWNGNGPKQPADSTLSDVYYNQALAAWQSKKLEQALASFDKAIALGYDKKNIFDYAIGVSYEMQNTGKMAEYAAMAYPLYGAEDSNYIKYIINDKIKNEKYDEAKQMLESYIASDPNNGQLYYVLGILYDTQNDFANAMVNYKKAIDLNPNDAQSLMQYGRQLCNKAYAIDDTASTKPANEYNKIRTEEVNPLFKEAIPYLEKAYELDPDNTTDALRYLRNVYYNLGDDENLKRIEAMGI